MEDLNYRQNAGRMAPPAVNHPVKSAAFVFMLMLLAGPVLAWWNQDWADRKKIIFDTSATGVPLTENLAQVAVPVRLHSGNFPYFLDTRHDGSDLRFVAGDDKTPLKYHIEQYEQQAGLATVWVQAPVIGPGSADAHIWMYYGNGEAPAAADPAGTYDLATVGVFHFSERSGLPRDSSAMANHPVQGSVKLGKPGIIDLAAGFEPSDALRIPAHPALGATAGKGLTVSGWIKLTKTQDRGLIFSLGPEDAGFHLEIIQNHLAAHIDVPGNTILAQTAIPLSVDRWHHVAVTIGATLKILVDGELSAQSEIKKTVDLSGDVVLGATRNGNGFTGLLDELQISNLERSANWITLAAKGQGPDSKLLVYGEDESAGAASGFTQFALIKTLALAVSVDGWTVIAITLLLGFIAFDVMTAKYFLLRRVIRLDHRFASEAQQFAYSVLLEQNASSKQQNIEQAKRTYQQSSLFRVFQTGLAELERLAELATQRGAGKTLPSEGLEVIRSGLDATIVEENNRLNERMVLVTVAISGAPFLGLLGTVIGVMMTFATVAATGDVNVNTIAPGVASAMARTVVGLLVAIPCMFGYNYLATLIGSRMSAMEVYADQLLSTFALFYSSTYAALENPHETSESAQAL